MSLRLSGDDNGDAENQSAIQGNPPILPVSATAGSKFSCGESFLPPELRRRALVAVRRSRDPAGVVARFRCRALAFLSGQDAEDPIPL